MYQTLVDAHKLSRVARTPGAVVPRDAYESFVGDIGWWAQVSEVVALRAPGIRAAFHIAEGAGHSFVPMGPRSPAVAPLRATLEMAGDGRAPATRVISADTMVATFRVEVTVSADGMQAMAAPTNSAQAVAASASDASLDGGRVAWGLITTSRDGGLSITRGERPAAQGESSASAEIEALREASKSFHTIRGAIFVPVLDALSVVQAILARRAAYGTPLFNALHELLVAAETHGVTVLPLWVPRTLNAVADAPTHLSHAETTAWAALRGIAIGDAPWSPSAG